MESIIKSVTAKALGVDESNVIIDHRLMGGMSNFTYVVEVEGAKYTFRIPGKNAEVFVDRQEEKENIAIIDALGINNETIYVDVEKGYKIAKFVEGTPLSEAEDTQPYLDEVAVVLHKLHDSGLKAVNDYRPYDRLDAYEKLVSEYDASKKTKQPLLTPLIINTSMAANQDKDNWLNALEAMGFTIDEFGPDTYRVPEIPMFMELSEAEDFINNFIENIHTSTDLRNTVVVDKLIMMSCKAAIKANDKLSPDEVNALIADLSKCVNPFSCPHGRPTFIKLTRYEIEKMFKRV